MEKIDYLSSSEAAWYLRYSENTLRISRVRGTLGGKTSPRYRKIGGRVYYNKSDLDNWINSTRLQINTSQNLI